MENFNNYYGVMYYSNVRTESPEEFIKIFKFFEGNDVTIEKFDELTRITEIYNNDFEGKDETISIYESMIKNIRNQFHVFDAYTEEEMELHTNYKDQ